jgi:hypothetical protein
MANGKNCFVVVTLILAGLSASVLLTACTDREAEIRLEQARERAAESERKAAEAKVAAANAESERLRLGGPAFPPIPVTPAPPTAVENCIEGSKKAMLVTAGMAIAGCAFDFLGGALLTGGTLCAGAVTIAKTTAIAAAGGCAIGAVTGNPAAGGGVNPLPGPLGR